MSETIVIPLIHYCRTSFHEGSKGTSAMVRRYLKNWGLRWRETLPMAAGSGTRAIRSLDQLPERSVIQAGS